jgi:hypothetical protein
VYGSRWTLGFLCSLVAAITARTALAEGADDATTAQALFDSAKKLMAEGKYDEACPKLEESQRLDAGTGTLLNLADCHEHQGKLATAWREFLEAAALAHREGSPAREETARERAAALQSRVTNVVITVTPNAQSGIRVVRDGTMVGPPQWGTPIPADPGQHVIEATAEGHRPFRVVVTVPAGEATTVSVSVPELQAAPDAPRRDSGPKAGLGTQRTLALVAGGVGVVGAGIGTVFGIISMGKHSDADQHCNGGSCRDQEGVDLRASARSTGNISTGGFIVGAVGLVSGAALWLTADRSPGAQTRVGIAPGFVQVARSF